MIDEPQIVQTAAQRVARIRLTIPRQEIQQVMGPGLDELMKAVADQGIEPVGPWFTHHLKMNPDVFDFEICIPVSKSVVAVGRVEPGELSAAKAARSAYRGGYEGLASAWSEFGAWITQQGLKSRPDLWEVYVKGPESSADPADWQTELNQPLEQ
jgi:effector-binding domain-containing protein